jgi:hypothetical protein
VDSTSNQPLICGYEPMSGPYICILPNNHAALGHEEHSYVTIQEYYSLNLRARGD